MFDPKAEARGEVSECLGVSSDRVRLHSSPGLACPAEYERACRQKRRQLRAHFSRGGSVPTRNG